MWKRKWFPWQQQETGEERPGEEGEEKRRRGQNGRNRGGGGREPVSQGNGVSGE